MKKQLILFVYALLPLIADTNAVKVDGIYYNLIQKGQAAKMTSHSIHYSGSIVLPEKVFYASIQ